MSQREDIRELLGTVWAGRYEILEFVGRGGMGGVFKARQLQMDREVALKVVHRSLCKDDKQVQRFEQEARTSSKLSHPNSIRVYDYGKTEDGRLFMAMEFLKGETLGALLAREGGLPPARVVHIARQMFKALAEAHQLGLVHRDLKPENIFICDIFGERDFVKVLDFGIAKAIGPSEESANLTQTGFICGTPRYLSPEQALGQGVDGRADLYSVGVLLYEMLTGRPPFVGENPISIVMKHVHDDPPPLSGMERYGAEGRRLTWLVERLLSKSASRRPAPAERIVEWLDGRIDEATLLGKPPGSVQGGGGRLASLQRAMEEPTRQRPAFDLPDGAGGSLGGFKDFGGGGDEATLRRPAILDADVPVPPPMPPQARKPSPAPRRPESQVRIQPKRDAVARAEAEPSVRPGDETTMLRSPTGDGPPSLPPVPDSEQTALIARPGSLGGPGTHGASGEAATPGRADATRQMSLADVERAGAPHPAQAERSKIARVRRRPTPTGERPGGEALTAHVRLRAGGEETRGSGKTPPWAWALVGVAVTLMAASGAFWWWSGSEAPAQTSEMEPAAAQVAEVAEESPAAPAPAAEAPVPVAEDSAPAPEPTVAGTLVGGVLGGADLPETPPEPAAAAPAPKPRARPEPEPEPRRAAPKAPASKPSKPAAAAAEPDWEAVEPDWDDPKAAAPVRRKPAAKAKPAAEPEEEPAPAPAKPAKEPVFEPF